MPSPGLDLALRVEALDCWNELAEYEGLLDAARRGVREVEVGGLPDAAAVVMALAARKQLHRPLVLLTADWPAAQAALEAAQVWMGSEAEPLLFPPRDFIPYAVVAQNPEVHSRRLQTMLALAQDPGTAPVLVVPVSALRRLLPPAHIFAAAVLTLAMGDKTDPANLAAALAAAGYERQPLVEAPGTFAVRGGLVDVFPLTATDPVRVEFLDDTIEGLRRFDAETQRSLAELTDVVLPPAREVPVPTGAVRASALDAIRASLARLAARFGNGQSEQRCRLEEQVGEDLEILAEGTAPGRWEAYLPFVFPPTSVLSHIASVGGTKPPLCCVLGASAVAAALEDLGRQEAARLSGFLAEGRVLPEQAEAFGQPSDWQSDLPGATILYCDALGRPMPGAQAQERLTIPGRQAPPFAGQWTLALDAVRRWRQARYRLVCWTASADRAERLARSLDEAGVPAVTDMAGELPLTAGTIHVAVGAIPAGFEVPGIRLVVLGEAELWGRRRSPARVRRGGTGAKLQSYEDLHVGDFVVHGGHGIGQYLGTTALSVQGKVRDYLVLRYEGTDRLYVPTEQVGLVQKYIGSEGRPPRLSRLGGSEWARTKQRVKDSVREMAEELVALYAARQSLEGHAFSPDGPWHAEFAAAFPYEETPDQLQSIAEIDRDMERAVPMERLLCGDVGYGKTEVAMRAAFKAVADGRQVAVLVPTTILAEQHYLTFTERFKGFPVSIRMLSRFRGKKEQEETVTALRRGTVDVVIGTHRLVQSDIDFRNLGLLVIDEEHRFGVAHKERLKQLRQTVDVVSMTATPIPRTLHMALAGIRDMSVINTPPENRYPVETMVVEWTPALIKEALHRELARGGQVYYLHNRVQSIGEAYERLRQLAPEADIVVGHGQMAEEELERVTTEFWRGEHQILLATTIIESGLDIPNANTVIVEDADRLGLAQLYQIRGRVGRSARMAYAYFTYRRERRLTEVAEKRLEAVKEFTELGSGFRIAMRDLEIRGAGNLLGPEQHGFVAAVGFELYAQLLEEAVREIRGDRAVPQTRTTLELSVDAYLDDAYMSEPRVKLEFYKKIHGAAVAAEVQAVEEELRDRFGPYPSGTSNLLRLAELRIQAQDLGLLGIAQEGRSVTFTFPNYAAPLLQRIDDLTRRFGRRLRAQTAPRPILRLQLDALDDATVLASVGSCLQALASHAALQGAGATPALSACTPVAAVAAARHGPPHAAPAAVSPGTTRAQAEALPRAVVPSAPTPCRPEVARAVHSGPAADPPRLAPPRRDRLADAIGWKRVADEVSSVRGAKSPQKAAARGPMRAALPRGMAIPAPAARPKDKKR